MPGDHSTERMGRVDKAFARAEKVRRPLTFFAAIGFALLVTVPVLFWSMPDNPSTMHSVALLATSVAIPLDIVVVLIWALARLKANPKAFDNE